MISRHANYNRTDSCNSKGYGKYKYIKYFQFIPFLFIFYIVGFMCGRIHDIATFNKNLYYGIIVPLAIIITSIVINLIIESNACLSRRKKQ